MIIQLFALFLQTWSMATEIAPKIVRGNKVQPFKYSWLASIHYLDTPICGGILIDASTMLTAAHCSEFKRGEAPLRVLAHRHNFYNSRLEENGLEFKIVSMTVHPKFGNHGYYYTNDIAIWKLELIQGESNVIPFGKIELDDGTYAKQNARLKIAGWGNGPMHLLEAEVEIGQCPKKSIWSSVHENDICTKAQGKNIRGADGGGPLFTEKADGSIVLVGIASYEWGYEGFYGKLSNHLDWIRSEIL